MTTISEVDITEILRTVTRDVFATMLDAQVELGPTREDKLDSPLTDGVVVLVGIGGTWAGSGRLFCTAPDARYLAGKMLMTEYSTVDIQVLDAMAEIANMIIGNLKATLEDQLGSLTLSVPTVIYGQNYLTHCRAALTWNILPVRCGGALLEVGYFLAPVPPSGLPRFLS